MIVGTARIFMRASWTHSLKEKRMIVKSLVDKVKSRFNVSIAEIADNDIHQSIVLGLACVSNDVGHVDSMLQNIINYIEDNCAAEILDIQTEII